MLIMWLFFSVASSLTESILKSYSEHKEFSEKKHKEKEKTKHKDGSSEKHDKHDKHKDRHKDREKEKRKEEKVQYYDGDITPLGCTFIRDKATLCFHVLSYLICSSWYQEKVKVLRIKWSYKLCTTSLYLNVLFVCLKCRKRFKRVQR